MVSRHGLYETDDGHEDLSAAIAQDFLKSQNVSDENIVKVKSLILVTKINAVPQNHLEKIMKDADCGHTATAHYFEVAEDLKKEILYKTGEEMDDLLMLQTTSKDNWIKQAEYLQANLTEEAIENAFKNLPIEAQDQEAEKIKNHFIKRRNHLVE